MIQKKICLLGAFAVGKTSLAARFVRGIFSEKYLTTVGVKIDKRVVQARGQEATLMVWDIAGEDEFHTVQPRYVQGAAGCLLVADGTRRATLDQAVALQQRMEQSLGPIPFLLLLNKADLTEDWEIGEAEIQALKDRGWISIRTSARTGDGVEAAFQELTERILAG